MLHQHGQDVDTMNAQPERTGCAYCFRTLNPEDQTEHLRKFVRCLGGMQNCGVLYHRTCWDSSEKCLWCAGRQAEAISIATPPPIEIKRKTRAIPIKPSAVHRSEDYIAAALILIVIVSAAASLLYYAQGAFVIRSTRPAKIALYKGSNNVATTEGDHLTTPFLLYGSYVLHAEKEGYEPVDMVLKPFARRTEEIRLDLSPRYGTVRIASSPSGAKVEVRNSYQHKSCQTPCEMSELFAIKSTIEISLPDYLPLVIEKEIPPKAVLDLGTLAFKGSLKVDSDPSGAEVYLDGQFGGKTPLQKDNLPAKSTKIEIRNQDSLRAYISKVSIQPQGLVNLGTVKLSNLGTLLVSSKPSGAKVRLNDKEVGTTPLNLTDVETGKHLLKLEIPGCTPYSQTIRIKPSEAIDLGTISFFGSMYVSSTPIGAEIYVDGKRMGTTPMTIPELLARQCNVELRMPGTSPSISVASIQPDRLTNLGEIKLQPVIVNEIPKATEQRNLPSPPQTASSSDQNLRLDYPSEATSYVIQMIRYAPDTEKIESVRREFEKLKKPPKGDGTRARKLNERAIDLIRRSKESEAMVILEEARRLDPSDVEVVNNLAYTYFVTSFDNYDFRKAKGMFVETLLLRPDRWVAWANMGRMFAAEGNEYASANCYVNFYRFYNNKEKAIRILENMKSDPHPVVSKASSTAYQFVLNRLSR